MQFDVIALLRFGDLFGSVADGFREDGPAFDCFLKIVSEHRIEVDTSSRAILLESRVLRRFGERLTRRLNSIVREEAAMNRSEYVRIGTNLSGCRSD